MSGTNAAAEPGSAAPTPAPNGQDQSYVVDDVRTAGDAIAGLLFGDDDKQPQQPQQPAREPPQQSGDDEPPDTGADDDRPTGEEDDKGQGEPAAEPAIEPPQSWNTDERAEFAKLPRALQQAVVRRESQREAVLTQRSQEAAEARRAFGEVQQAATNQRIEYLNGLQKMMALAAPEAAAFNNVDWVAVQAASPAEYTRLHAAREALRGRLGVIEQEFQQRQQAFALQQQQEQQQALGELVTREHAALNAAMPDMADPVKGAALRKDLSTYLQDTGRFSLDEINQAYDHRLIVMAHKAMLYDRQIANAAAADAKRNNVAPQVQRPGVSQSGDRSAPQTRLQQRANRLGRTHDVRDAGSLIAELL